MKPYWFGLAIVLSSVILYTCSSARLAGDEQAIKSYLTEFEKDLKALDAEAFVSKQLKQTVRSKQAVVNVVKV